MANNNQDPGTKQPVGYTERSRDDAQTTDGTTESPPSEEIGTENVEQDLHSSEGEPGRAQSESTGGQKAAAK